MQLMTSLRCVNPRQQVCVNIHFSLWTRVMHSMQSPQCLSGGYNCNATAIRWLRNFLATCCATRSRRTEVVRRSSRSRVLTVVTSSLVSISTQNNHFATTDDRPSWHTHVHTHTHTHTQTHTDRQTDRQTDTHVHCSSVSPASAAH